MVYTVFYKTSSFAGYCFLNKNSIHPNRRDVFNFKHFEVTLVKFQICSFIVINVNGISIAQTIFFSILNYVKWSCSIIRSFCILVKQIVILYSELNQEVR